MYHYITYLLKILILWGGIYQISLGKSTYFHLIYLPYLLSLFRIVLGFTLCCKFAHRDKPQMWFVYLRPRFCQRLPQIPPLDGHHCLNLMIGTMPHIGDFHRLVHAHSRHTTKTHWQNHQCVFRGFLYGGGDGCRTRVRKQTSKTFYECSLVF